MHRVKTPTIAAALAAVTLLLVATTVVLAQERLGGKLRAGESITVPAGETLNHDLYVFAGNLTVNGTVEGDVVAGAGQVTITGTVTGDVVLGAGTVTLSGTVEGDVRVGGGQVTIDGEVGEDALIGGGQLTVADGARIGEDLIFSAGQASVAGDVAGSIEGSAGTYTRTGAVGGTENVETSEDAPDDVDPGVADLILGALRHFIVVVLFGALALWLAPRALAASEANVRRRPLASLGFGVLGVIGFIATSVVLLVVIVLVSIPLGLLGFDSLVAIALLGGVLTLLVGWFVFWLTAAFVVDAVVGLALATLASPGGGGNRWRRLGLLAAGAVVVVILTSLPIVGWLVKLIVIALGIGAMLLAAWTSWRGRRNRRSEAPPSAG